MMNYDKWKAFWSVWFGTTSFLIIISNSLSIVILLKRRLRKRPHYLLIDLAIADLLVGLFAIPIYMTFVISEENLLSPLILTSVDMFTAFCSIFTLAVISLERLHAIVRPLRHRQLSSKSYIVALVTPWVFSLIVASTRVLLHFSVMINHHFVAVMIVSLSTPLLISCVSYCIIWKTQASRIQNEVRARSDAKLSKTLLLIIGTFIFTWLPFQVLVIVLNMCLSCRGVPIAFVFMIKLLHFSNSFINFIIYCFRMPDYRHEVSEILIRFTCCRFRHRELYPLAESQSSFTLISFTSRTVTFHNAGFA